VLAESSSPSRICFSSVANACRDSGVVLPVEAPWSTRSRALRVRSSMSVSVVSTVPIQRRASCPLRAYWSLAASRSRSCIAWLVPLGESEGRLISRPVETRSWACAIRPIWVCSEVRERLTSSCWVIRTVIGRSRSG